MLDRGAVAGKSFGANGQTQTKTFADEAAAKSHAEKLIEEKTEKGYVEK